MRRDRNVRFGPVSDQVIAHQQRHSHLGLLGHLQRIVHFDAENDPFWRRAEELGVTVFMHPDGAENVVRDDALEGRGDLGNVIGNPLETTVFLSSMIFDGVLDRFPRLSISAAHAGGYLPSYLGRSEVACKYRSDANCANRRSPSEYLRTQILVDSMIFSSEGLSHLVAEVGTSQIAYGSDIPFDWPDTIDLPTLLSCAMRRRRRSSAAIC